MVLFIRRKARTEMYVMQEQRLKVEHIDSNFKAIVLYDFQRRKMRNSIL